MSDFCVLITHRTLAGKRDEVRAVWMKHMAPAIDGNAGHLAYFYTFADEDPDVIRAFQRYESAAEAKAFLAHPAYAAYEAEVAPLLVGPPDVKTGSTRWVKGE